VWLPPFLCLDLRSVQTYPMDKDILLPEVFSEARNVQDYPAPRVIIEFYLAFTGTRRLYQGSGARARPGPPAQWLAMVIGPVRQAGTVGGQ
jgi:hypothetical protein